MGIRAVLIRKYVSLSGVSALELRLAMVCESG